MTNATTLSSFQASLNEQDDSETPAPSPLAALAERMVRERSDNPESGDPFDGMSLDVDPSDAFGLVEAQVRQWCEDNNRWATAIEIRHKTDRLIQEAQNARPGPVKAATYTVEAGVVTSFTPDAAPDAAPAELPGMPAAPEPINGLRVPSDSIFGDDSEFSMSSALMQRARTLIERHPDHLKHLESMSVLYLWKKSGGKSKGRATFGKCSKPSGLLKHFSEAQFVIWLAADHCRAAGYRDRELEALLFHEMLHTAVTEPDENTGRGGGPALVPHELEVFRAEVEIYGLWAPDLKAIAPAFRQVNLFDATADNEIHGIQNPGVFRGQPSDFERLEAAGAAYADDDDEIDPDARTFDANDPENIVDPMGNPPPDADAPLVCSVCGTVVDEDELSLEEVSEARQNPAVVLCEACGEDGVIDEGDDDA